MAPGESSGVGTDPQQVTVVRSRRPSRLTTVCSTCLGPSVLYAPRAELPVPGAPARPAGRRRKFGLVHTFRPTAAQNRRSTTRDQVDRKNVAQVGTKYENPR
jgi:hypothetical protein